MALRYNKGGRNPAPDNSTIGLQINDEFWSRAAVKYAKEKRYFTQLGDTEKLPK